MGTYGDLWGPMGGPMGTFGDLCVPMGAYGDLWAPLGTYGHLWGTTGAYGDVWGPIGAYRDLWAPLGTYGHLWGPMGAFGDLWGPMGTFGGLWAPLRTYGELLGPMGTYGVGGINLLHTHFDTKPPHRPFLQSSDLYDTYHTAFCIHCKNNMPYQTSNSGLYKHSCAPQGKVCSKLAAIQHGANLPSVPAPQAPLCPTSSRCPTISVAEDPAPTPRRNLYGPLAMPVPPCTNSLQITWRNTPSGPTYHRAVPPNPNAPQQHTTPTPILHAAT